MYIDCTRDAMGGCVHGTKSDVRLVGVTIMAGFHADNGNATKPIRTVD